jgi:hypothetical protein
MSEDGKRQHNSSLGEGYGKHLGRRADMGIAFKLVTQREGRS